MTNDKSATAVNFKFQISNFKGEKVDFVLVCIIGLVVLGVVAAVVSHFQKGDDEIKVGHDCASCSAVASGECKIGCLLEEKKRREGNKKA